MNISCFSLVNRAGFEPDGVKVDDSILELVPLAFVPLAFVPFAFVPFAVSMPAVATVPFESSMPSAGGLAGCSTIMICVRKWVVYVEPGEQDPRVLCKIKCLLRLQSIDGNRM